jgi:hypothetical protein
MFSATTEPSSSSNGAPHIDSGFIPRIIHLEPIAYDPDNYKRWTELFLQRCQLYGIADVATQSRTRPPLPTYPGPLASDASAAERQEHQALHDAYRAALYQQEKYDFDRVQLTNLFYQSLGPRGMTELELRKDNLKDVFHSMTIINEISTKLIGQEISNLTSYFTRMPWEKEESIKDFKYRFNQSQQRLESAGVFIPKELIRD